MSQPVLLEDAQDTAAKLRARPGQWFVIAAGPRRRMRSMLSTATKIRKGKLVAFRTAECGGRYEVRTLTSPTRADQVGDVEIKARWLAEG